MRLLYKRIVIFIVGIVALMLVWRSGLIKFMTIAEFKQTAESWYVWTQAHYMYALLGYCLFFIVAGVCAIPITVLLTIVGGFLFGPLIGGAYAIFCATVSSVIIVILVRYFLGKLIQATYQNKLHTFNAAIKKHGKWYIIVMQIFPFTPTPLLNICVGLTTIPVWTFAWATAIGLAPGTLLYTFAGQYLHRTGQISDIVSWQTFIWLTFGSILLLLPIVWSYYKNGLNNL